MPKYLFAQNVTAEELNELKSFSKLGHRQFQRSRIIELSASGWRCPMIAQATRLSIDRVRQWIHRFNQDRIPGLIAKKSPGRPPKFCCETRDKIRALIGDCPTDYGISKTRWTLADIACTAERLNWVFSISIPQVRLLFAEVNWTYTRAKKWQRSPDSQYRLRRNRK